MELLPKIFSHVRKRLHLRPLSGFWMCPCCVRNNYLSVNFFTFFVTFFFVVIQSYLFFNFSDFPWNLWNSYTCTAIGSKIVLERLVISSNLSELKFQCGVRKKRKWKHIKYVFCGAFLSYQVFHMKKYVW